MKHRSTVLLVSAAVVGVTAAAAPAAPAPADPAGPRSGRAAAVYRQVVSAPVTVQNNHGNSAEAACPDGMFAAGGGMTTDGTADRVFTTSSFSTGRGWYIDFRNVSGAPRTVRAAAVCSTAQQHNHSGVREPIAPGRAATIYVRCPAGSTPSGGGYSAVSFHAWESAPQPDASWGISGVNTRYVDGSAVPTVTCSAEPHRLVLGDPVTLLPGETKDAVVACPAGETPTGGGGWAGRALLHNVFLTRNFPRGDSWVVSGTNTGSDENTLTPKAICTPK